MNKIKSLFTKAKGKAKLLVTSCVAAVTVCAMSICACAEDATSTDMSSIITSAGETLKQEFVILVQTLVPLLVSIGVVGLSVFAIVSLFSMAKKFFKKAAG